MIMEFNHQCSHITRIWLYIFAIVITLFQNSESPGYTYPPSYADPAYTDYRQQAVQLPAAYGFSYVAPPPPPPQIDQLHIQEFYTRKASILGHVDKMMQSGNMAWFIFYNIDRDEQYHTLKDDLSMLRKEHEKKYAVNPLFQLFVFSLHWFGRYPGATKAFRAALNEMLYYEKFKMTSTPWVVCIYDGVVIYSYPLPFNILNLRAQIDAYLYEQWQLVFFYTPQPPMPAVSSGVPKTRPSPREGMAPSNSKPSRAYEVLQPAPDAPAAVSEREMRKATRDNEKSKSISSAHKVPPAAPEPPTPAAVKARAKTDPMEKKKGDPRPKTKPVERADSKPKNAKPEEKRKMRKESNDKPRQSELPRDRGERRRESTVMVTDERQVPDPIYRRGNGDMSGTDDVPRTRPQQPPPPHAQYPPYDPSQYAPNSDPYLNQYGSYNPQYSAPNFKYLAEINKTAKKIMDTLETAIQTYYVVAILFIKMPYANPGSKDLGDAFDSFVPDLNQKGRVYFEKVNMSPFLTMGLNPTMGTFLGNINEWIEIRRKTKPDLKSIDALSMPHLVVFMYHFAEISIQFKKIEDMKDAGKKVKEFLDSHSIGYKLKTDEKKRPPKKAQTL